VRYTLRLKTEESPTDPRTHAGASIIIFIYFQHGCQNASQDNVMVKRIS